MGKEARTRALRAIEGKAMEDREDLIINTEDWVFEPKGDMILIEEQAQVETTSGGIVVPEEARERHYKPTAVVKAVGPGRYSTTGELIPMRIKVGDRVVVAPSLGVVSALPKSHGRGQVLVSESTIIATVTEKKQLQ